MKQVQLRDTIYEREGKQFPGKTYREAVLEPAYESAKRRLLAPMLAVHKAHLIMLSEQKLIARSAAASIGRALLELPLDQVEASSYTGEFEDLFFQVEHLVTQAAGEAAGNLHIARSRNDMGVTLYRMALREQLLEVLSSIDYLIGILLQISELHTETLMMAYTHTQQAQPTTLAHYLLAVVDVLNRDWKRLEHAFEHCNRSPMGAAALTTSGFSINRFRVMYLLAFEGLVENSYDAISGADYLGEAANALQLSAINLGRVVQDFLLWSTQEFGTLRLADPYVQISSIMPQKRNPVSLEHIRSLLSSCVGTSQTVLQMLHNTPFGDIVDTEDDLQPFLWKSCQILRETCTLLANVIGTASFDIEAWKQRLENSFAMITELADAIVRTDSLPFRTAHQIVSQFVTDCINSGRSPHQISWSDLQETAKRITGNPLQIDENTFRLALDPIHFVTIRKVEGGPNPTEIERLLSLRKKEIQNHAEWLQNRLRILDNSRRELDERLTSLLNDQGMQSS